MSLETVTMADSTEPDQATGSPLLTLPRTVESGHTLKLNPNCCYKACNACASIKRLRAFSSENPHDWRERLVGSPRLLYAARHFQ